MTVHRRWLATVWAGALLTAGCGGAAHTTAIASGTTVAPGRAQAPAPKSRVAKVPDSDWPTFDYDAARTGVGPARTGITAGNLRALRARIVHLDGTVDAAPIELHTILVGRRRRDVIVVTTSYGRTIAIDPGTGQRLWQFSPASAGSLQGSSQVTTATPVADPDRRYVYAASPDGMVHKLMVSSGREVRSGGWPVRVTFDPSKEKLAGALNLSGPSLLVVTGGYYGDAPVYQGHVVLIDRASGRITHVFNALCSNRTTIIDPPRSCPQSDAAIWARQGSVVEPGIGRILVATGNSDFNGRTDWGDSVLELSSTLRLLHNWTPTDQAALNSSDNDIGSTEPALLPPLGGRRLALQGGKDQKLRLLDLDRLDGSTGPAGSRTGGELEDMSSPGAAEVLTAPAVWSQGRRTYVFVADDGGSAAYLARGGSHPGLTLAWHNGTAGTSPVLAGGLLYVYDETGGALNVYAPASGHRIARLAAPTGHWNSPIADGGRIILPVGNYHDASSSGELVIWHLPGR